MPKLNRYIGKVILLVLPNNRYVNYRWIVRKREDGRYIVRAPKNGVLVRELYLKRDKDYGKETLLPKKSKIWILPGSKKTRKNKKYKTKTRKSRKSRKSKKIIKIVKMKPKKQ